MSVPHFTLTDSQWRLLGELVLNPLPLPEEAAAARGLAMHQLQADVPALQWMGLITETKGPLSVTAQGAAVFYRDQNEKAESRLAQVAEFADLLEELTADEIDLSRLALVLRRFAQGEISLSEAVTHLRAGR